MKCAFVSEIILILELSMFSYDLHEDYFGIVEYMQPFFPDHWSVDIMV